MPVKWQARRVSPRIRKCPDCQLRVIGVLYDACLVYWDPEPLSSFGELEAHLHGMMTYLFSGGNIYKRRADTIKQSPDGLGGTLHRNHVCEVPPPSGSSLKAKPEPQDGPGF